MRAPAEKHDSLDGAIVALVVLGLAVGASLLVAEEPTGPTADQEAPLNDAEARSEGPRMLVYGLSVEKSPNGSVLITDVEPGTAAYEAGLRAGDRLVRFGEAKKLPFDKFLERAQQIAERTDEEDKIAVVYSRDGDEREGWMRGSGRPPEELRDIQEKSEEAIEEKLAPDPEDEEPSSSGGEISTEELEAYLALRGRMSRGPLSDADSARYDRLATALYGGLSPAVIAAPYGGWVGGPVGAAGPGSPATTGPSPNGPATGAPPATGQGDATPGTAIGDPSAQAENSAPTPSVAASLGAELAGLRQAQAQGTTLTAAQVRRLAVLDQLSRGSVAPAGGATNPAQLQQLAAAQRAGNLSPEQLQQFRQLQQQQFMSAMARSVPGANRNMPLGTAAPAPAAGGGAVPSAPAAAGNAGSGIGK